MGSMWIWMLVSMGIALIILAVLYYFGNKLQKKQAAQKELMREQAQPVTMLVIDKKMLPMKDANLPKIVMEQTPKRYQRAKLPIVRAKIGPQITNLICDDGIFDDMPVKGEVKAMVSGIYIVSVKNVRGKVEAPQGKKSLGQKLREKQKKYQNIYDEDTKQIKQTKEEKAAAKAKAKAERERAAKIK